MPVSSLKVTQLRNFSSRFFEFSPEINIIFGPNGCGKTTILESLYILGSGRSFRSATLSNIIQKDKEGSLIELLVADKAMDPEGITLKMRKKRHENVEYFISQQAVNSVSELAKLMPVQLLNLHGYLLLEDAPEHRRKFIDWMMFHVEHSFFKAWQAFQRILKQRNALLKMRASPQELLQWTILLGEAGQQVHDLRKAQLDKWIPFAKSQCIDLPGVFNLDFQYKHGWHSEGTLRDALDQGLQKDMLSGFTHAGPHRADLLITIDGVDASHRLSTGQQKTFVSTLQIAQTEWMMSQTETTPIILIDDLPSELDASARERLADKISEIKAQVFITSVDKNAFAPFTKRASTLITPQGEP